MKLPTQSRSLAQCMALAKLSLHCVLNPDFTAAFSALVKISNKKLDKIISKC